MTRHRAIFTALLLSILTTSALLADSAEPLVSKPTCRWWQFGPCSGIADVAGQEGLPPEAPRDGVVISVDVATNTAYLYKDGSLVRKSAAATGANRVPIVVRSLLSRSALDDDCRMIAS